MRADELVAATRITGQLPSLDLVYTDARVLRELTDMQLLLFERMVVAPREGAWLNTISYTTVSGTQSYRVPARAVAQIVERIDLKGSEGLWCELEKLEPREAAALESASASRPQAFVLRSDKISLLPTPNASYTLRVQFYLRPSRLVSQQSSGTIRGRITAINTTTQQVTVNALPYDQELSTPAAITSALQTVDIVRRDGAHDVVVWGVSQTIAGMVLTLGQSVTGVEIGDFVRAAEQSDWPQLPQELHRTLCDATASSILLAKGVTEKAMMLAGKVKSDVDRFQEMLEPRVREQPKRLRPRGGLYARAVLR